MAIQSCAYKTLTVLSLSKARVEVRLYPYRGTTPSTFKALSLSRVLGSDGAAPRGVAAESCRGALFARGRGTAGERHLSRFSRQRTGNRPWGAFILSFCYLHLTAYTIHKERIVCRLLHARAGPQSQSPSGRNAAPLHMYDSMNAGAKAALSPGAVRSSLPLPALRRVYLRPPCASSGCQPSPPGPAGRLWGRRRWQPPPLPPPPPLPRRPPSRRCGSPVASTRGGAAR